MITFAGWQEHSKSERDQKAWLGCQCSGLSCSVGNGDCIHFLWCHVVIFWDRKVFFGSLLSVMDIFPELYARNASFIYHEDWPPEPTYLVLFPIKISSSGSHSLIRHAAESQLDALVLTRKVERVCAGVRWPADKITRWMVLLFVNWVVWYEQKRRLLQPQFSPVCSTWWAVWLLIFIVGLFILIVILSLKHVACWNGMDAMVSGFPLGFLTSVCWGGGGGWGGLSDDF